MGRRTVAVIAVLAFFSWTGGELFIILWQQQKQFFLFNFMIYNVSSSMAQDKSTIIDRYPARSNLEDRVSTLEMWFSRVREALNTEDRAATERATPSPQLPPELPLLTQRVVDQRREVLTTFYRTDDYPHFRVRRDDREVLAVLHGLKNLEWEYRKVRQVGVFEDEVGDEEWLAALKGPAYSQQAPTRRIAWRAKYMCKSFVEQYLGSDYTTAERVFCLSGGKEIKDLKFTNISKNSDVCDEQTGKIAEVIRKAIRFVD